jgi:hypothetical protein
MEVPANYYFQIRMVAGYVLVVLVKEYADLLKKLLVGRRIAAESIFGIFTLFDTYSVLTI